MAPQAKLIRLPLDDIHITDLRKSWRSERRCDGKGIAELLRLVKARRWLQAVTVRPWPGSGYELIDGERRVSAARLAGEDAIDALVLDVDNATALAIALLANLGRKRLKGIEMARLCAQVGDALEALTGSRPTQHAIGEWVGLKQPTVSQYMTIASAFDDASLDEASVSLDDLAPVSAAVLEDVARLPVPDRHDWLVELSNGTCRRLGEESAAAADSSDLAREVPAQLRTLHEAVADTGVDLEPRAALVALAASLRLALLLAVRLVARSADDAKDAFSRAWGATRKYRSPIFEGLRTRGMVVWWVACHWAAATWRRSRTVLAGIGSSGRDPESTDGSQAGVQPPFAYPPSPGRGHLDREVEGDLDGIPAP